MIDSVKVCCKCGESKPVEAFGKHARRPDGLRDHCSQCGRKQPRVGSCGHCAATFKHRGQGPLPKLCVGCEASLSWCHVCAVAKPHSAFRAQAKTRTGRQAKCRECSDAQYHRTPAAKASRRASHLRLRYGMTVDDFDQLVIDQGGRCGICEEQLSGSIAVDHDHESGRVRGLLCYRCNTGLGSLGDSIDGVMRAVAYLLSRVNVLEGV